MKSLLKYIVLLLFVCPSFLSADCTEKLTITHITLEGVDSVLHFSFDMEVSPGCVRSHESLRVYPVLRSPDQELLLPFAELMGRNRQKVHLRSQALGLAPDESAWYEMLCPRYCPVTFHYKIELPLPDWVDEDTGVSFIYSTYGCESNCQVESTPGVVHMRIKRAEVLDPRVSFLVPCVEVKERQESGNAYLDFPSGQSAILPDYRRNPEELLRIRETLRKVDGDEDMTITGIYITGYASPDGSNALNERLSGARAEALKNYLRQATRLPASIFHARVGGEDWQRLRELISESFIPSSELILSIIDNGESNDHKEQQLKSLGGGIYRDLSESYFPLLRRVEYEIRYRVRDYNVSEASRLLSRDPGRLSPYEFYLLSENYEKESKEWKNIFRLSAGLYPGDEVSQVNALGIHLGAGDIEGSEEYVSRLSGSSLPEAWNNLGVYLLLQGQVEEARKLFTEAAGEGLEEAKYNLQEIKK